ncbi:MAG: hemerythrin domain-containing protein [Bacteroidota bacterium]|nr:hemerythrin domain-containing protein [Bacteroidota bacterium]
MRNFFRNLSIQVKLLTGFGIIVAVMMVTGIREIILLNNLDQKSKETRKAVNTSYYLKESRFLINREQILLGDIYNSTRDNDVEEALVKHLTNVNSFNNIYEFVETSTRPTKNSKFNEQNQVIRDSITYAKETYSTTIEPVFERMAQHRKNLNNIDIFYAEYLKINAEDSLGSQEKLLSKGALKISIKDDMTGMLNYISETIESLSKTIKSGEDISAEISASLEKEMQSLYEAKINETFIFVVSILLISIVISFLISSLIIQPIKSLREQIEFLTSGELPDHIKVDGHDEIGEMGQALSTLVEGLRNTAKFSIQIGQEDFSADYRPMSKEDVLGNSLLSMRSSLQAAKKEEQKRQKEDSQRNRVSEGLALFGDILRRYSDNLSELSNEIISNLVKFMKANQGAVFILNDENPDNIFLDLQGAYAYNRKKFLSKKIAPGEGLVGAVFLEKYTMYLTEVPEDFVEIESGLGNENPKSILIVPLKVDEKVLGVIELASFNAIEPYEIDMAERISESIASTLSTTRINARTSKLLKQSEEQAVKMREQEEEMLRNIEELKNIHEEGKKKGQALKTELESNQKQNEELDEKLNYYKSEIKNYTEEADNLNEEVNILYKKNALLIESGTSAIVSFDKDYKIIDFNKAAEELWGIPASKAQGELFTFLLTDEKAKTVDLRIPVNKNNLLFKRKEIFIKNRDNKKVPVLYSTVKSSEGNNEMYYAYFIDLRQRIGLEEDLRKIEQSNYEKQLASEIKLDRMEAILKQNKLSYVRKVESDDLIYWDELLMLGLDVIDQQHENWIALLNDMYNVLKVQSSEEENLEAVREFVDYSDYHFGFEEKYFAEFNFKYKEQHIEEHKLFLSELEDIKSALSTGETAEKLYSLLSGFRRRIIDHIQSEDKKYVDLFKSKGLV